MTRTLQTPIDLASETPAKAVPRTQGLALYAPRALALAALGQNPVDTALGEPRQGVG